MPQKIVSFLVINNILCLLLYTIQYNCQKLIFHQVHLIQQPTRIAKFLNDK